MATFVHIDGAETEAKDIIFACLSWALSVALTINELLIFTAFRLIGLTRRDAGAIMVNVVVRAHGGAHIALCDNEGGRALRVPFLVALLAIMALFVLSISSPERKRLFTAKFCLFKELWASKFCVLFKIGVIVVRLIICRLTSTSLLALLLLGLTTAALLTRLLRLALLTGWASGLTLLLFAASSTLSSAMATSTGRGSVSVVGRGTVH